MFRTRLVVFALVVGALGSSGVLAQSADPNAALLDTGEALLRDGEAVAARAVLRRAHESSPSARSAGTLGLAELAAGDPIAADVLLRALPPDDAWVRREQARITAALAEIDRQVGVVVLRGAAAGREVRVEEGGAPRLVGTTPLLPFRVRPGRVVVRVGTASRDLVVGAGTRVEVDFATEVAATPFPEGPPGTPDDFSNPFPTGPDAQGGTSGTPSAPSNPSAPGTPGADGGFAFGGPGDVSIPPTLRERYARGEVADVPVSRGEWQAPDRHRRLAIGFAGRGIPSYRQITNAFDTDGCCDPRGVIVPSVMGRLSLHPRFAVVGRLAFPVVVNGEGDGLVVTRHGGSGEATVVEDEWDGVFGVELDAYAELDTGLLFIDFGVRLRLWFARSQQTVTYQAGWDEPRQTARGDVLQVGPAVGAVLRPGLWLDRTHRVRFAAEIAGGKDLFEVGGGLEIFLF